MAVVLGINAFHAGAAAAVVVDGVPLAAIAEERLNRIKYFAGFPGLAIVRCLEVAKVEFRDIDAVAVGRDPSANRSKKIGYVLKNPSKLPNLLRIRSSRRKLGGLDSLIADGCHVNPDELRFEQFNVEHHLAHTASAYFISPWDRAAGLTIDGSGDFATCMLTECEGSKITVKQRIHVPHSLGSLYTMICEFIGYGQYGDEGKVMGLAPLGRDTLRETFDDMLRLTPTGIELNQDYFQPFGSNPGLSISESGRMHVHRHHSNRMVDLFGQPREPHGEITQRDRDLAFGVQRVFEEGYFHLLNLLHPQVPCDRLALAGGCALNSVANGKLFDRTPFRETCIQPAAGDDGLALGAALYVSNVLLEEGNRWVMSHTYLGPEYSDAEIEKALEQAGVAGARHERQPLLEEVAAEIDRGRVVGWFQGRMEWGPRALGNRSILAHPGLPNMKDVLNARIKHREPFRPFAPAVLAERQSDVFEHTHPSPFMLHVFRIRPEWRERLVAVNHVDDTGRLQSVTREENPLYHDLISAFERRSGIPLVLNTSFNENEPIVSTPAEAIDCYLRTRMDSLAIGPFLCHKTDEDGSERG